MNNTAHIMRDKRGNYIITCQCPACFLLRSWLIPISFVDDARNDPETAVGAIIQWACRDVIYRLQFDWESPVWPIDVAIEGSPIPVDRMQAKAHMN